MKNKLCVWEVWWNTWTHFGATHTTSRSKGPKASKRRLVCVLFAVALVVILHYPNWEINAEKSIGLKFCVRCSPEGFKRAAINAFHMGGSLTFLFIAGGFWCLNYNETSVNKCFYLLVFGPPSSVMSDVLSEACLRSPLKYHLVLDGVQCVDIVPSAATLWSRGLIYTSKCGSFNILWSSPHCWADETPCFVHPTCLEDIRVFRTILKKSRTSWPRCQWERNLELSFIRFRQKNQQTDVKLKSFKLFNLKLHFLSKSQQVQNGPAV